MKPLAHRLHHRTSRGFTLTELMIVVAMIGVLSALALVGYRKYVDSAKNNEAVAVIQAIRSAEEEFRDKTLTYFDVSNSGNYYPRAKGTVDSRKASWQKAATDTEGVRWATLGVNVSGPVAFTYKANAGQAGTPINVPGGIDYSPAPTFTTPTKDWYIVQAYGDPNENGKPTVLLSTSFSNEIVVHEDQ